MESAPHKELLEALKDEEFGDMPGSQTGVADAMLCPYQYAMVDVPLSTGVGVVPPVSHGQWSLFGEY